MKSELFIKENTKKVFLRPPGVRVPYIYGNDKPTVATGPVYLREYTSLYKSINKSIQIIGTTVFVYGDCSEVNWALKIYKFQRLEENKTFSEKWKTPVFRSFIN